MNKAKLLASLVGTSLVTLGGAFASESAQAITLKNGDFVILDIQFEAADTTGLGSGLVNRVKFRNLTVDDGLGNVGNATFGEYIESQANVYQAGSTSIPIGPETAGESNSGLALTTVTDSQLGGVAGFANAETARIRSFDLADQTGDFFTILDSRNGPPSAIQIPNTTFPLAQNFFGVDQDFQAFWNISLDDGSILSYELNEFETIQTTPLSTTAPSTFVFSGTGRLLSDNNVVGIADFSASAVFDPDAGIWETDGGLVVQVTDITIPEPGTIVGLLALSGLGLGLKLKKQS